jgi:CheY-like chemotaxis protein
MSTLRVLVVDDEPLILEMVASALRNLDYEVLTANDPITALELCKSTKPCFDLLVADVLMPVMSGPELAQRVTNLCPRSAVLLMSGHVALKNIPRGAVFLAKPFLIADLYRAVEKALATLADQPPLA